MCKPEAGPFALARLGRKRNPTTGSECGDAESVIIIIRIITLLLLLPPPSFKQQKHDNANKSNNNNNTNNINTNKKIKKMCEYNLALGRHQNVSN